MWETEMVRLVRVMVDDLEATPRMTDDRIQEIVLTAAQLVNTEITFSISYTVDLDEMTLTPDPTNRSTGRDDNFINLTVLKAACICDRNSAARAVRKAMMFKDAKTTVDTRASAAGWQKLLEKGGYCAGYMEAKMEYGRGSLLAAAGAAIISPFRLYATNTWPGDWE